MLTMTRSRLRRFSSARAWAWVLLTTALAIGSLMVFRPWDRAQQFEGKTAAQWLTDLCDESWAATGIPFGSVPILSEPDWWQLNPIPTQQRRAFEALPEATLVAIAKNLRGKGPGERFYTNLFPKLPAKLRLSLPKPGRWEHDFVMALGVLIELKSTWSGAQLASLLRDLSGHYPGDFVLELTVKLRRRDPEIIRLMNDPWTKASANTRQTVLRFLSEIGNSATNAMPVIESAATSADPELRYLAIRTVSALNHLDPGAIRVLERGTNDPADIVRNRASRILEQLAGKQLGKP